MSTLVWAETAEIRVEAAEHKDEEEKAKGPRKKRQGQRMNKMPHAITCTKLQHAM
jgi:hypothetical protein